MAPKPAEPALGLEAHFIKSAVSGPGQEWVKEMYSKSEKPRFLCQWVLNISRQRPNKLHVFGRQPTFDNMLSQGPPPEAKI